MYIETFVLFIITLFCNFVFFVVMYDKSIIKREHIKNDAYYKAEIEKERMRIEFEKEKWNNRFRDNV